MSINITSNLREFVELVELKCLSTSETLAPAWENTNTKGLARAQGIETAKSETIAQREKTTRKDSRGSGRKDSHGSRKLLSYFRDSRYDL